MSTNFARHVAINKNQSQVQHSNRAQPLPGRANEMTKAADGKFTFKANIWTQLERFLIMGCEGNTYYASEARRVDMVCNALDGCIAQNAIQVVDMIVNVSDTGRAAKNDWVLFSLARVMAKGDEAARIYARKALPKVARIGTHLLHFAEFINTQKGWGSGTRKAFNQWFLSRNPNQIAFQAIKYANRDGWTLRDVLRKSHPFGTPEQNLVFKYIAKKGDLNAVGLKESLALPPILLATVEAKTANLKRVCELITQHNLPWEALPTHMLNETEVWEALLPGLGITALIRNLGRLTHLGVINVKSDLTKFVVGQLTNQEVLRKGRVHPLNLLNAMRIYAKGHGDKGSLMWMPVEAVNKALEEAFELSFGLIEPSGKRQLIAVDVSSSMTFKLIPGTQFTPREAATALALISLKNETNAHIVGFSHKLMPLPIEKNFTFKQAIAEVEKMPFSSTDCSAPMRFAIENKLNIDMFQIYTDNETNARAVPSEVLKNYRQISGIHDAKLAVVAMEVARISIADPRDPYMMDFAGFDTAVPQILSEFART